MPNNAKPIPEGFHTVTPYLTVRDGAAALDFYKRALGATEIMRHQGPDGRIMHAEIRIGDSPVMLGEHPDVATLPSEMPPIGIYLYVTDVDALTELARRAGADVTMPVQDQWYGDRSGAIRDPFGITWWIATHKEDVSAEEMRRRQAAMSRQ